MPSWSYGASLLGATGATFTTLTASGSSVKVVSPTSLTLLSGAVGGSSSVTTLESFDSASEGVYMQFTVPSYFNGDDAITVGLSALSGQSVPGASYPYLFLLAFFLVGDGSYLTAYNDYQSGQNGTWSPGDTFSIYVDTSVVNFYQNGTKIHTTPNLPTGILQFQASPYSDNSLIDSVSLNNIRFYPSGKVGHDGPSTLRYICSNSGICLLYTSPSPRD